MSFAAKAVEFYKKTGYLWIIGWLILAGAIGLTYGVAFPNDTETSFTPPEGTDSLYVRNVINDEFPALSNGSTFIYVIHADDGHSVLRESVRLFTNNTHEFLLSRFGAANIASFKGYYVFANTTLDHLKWSFVSENNLTTIITVDIRGDNVDELLQYTEYLRNAAHDMCPNGISVYVTGEAAAGYDQLKAVDKDLGIIHLITIPLILILLTILLVDPRLLLVTILTITITTAVSFGVMDLMVLYLNAELMSFIPSAMIAIILGVGVDYNLFLLSRYREEREHGKTNREAVKEMLEHAGHTISVSGLTLAVSFAGLVFFPVNIFSSFGLAITVTILIALAVNLSFTPALLLIGRGWFHKKKNKDPNGKDLSKTFWTRSAHFSTKYAWAVILIILALAVPVGAQVLFTEPNSEFTSLAPMGRDSQIGFEYLQNDFSAGAVGPIDVLFVSDQPGIVWSRDFFNMGHEIAAQIIHDVRLNNNSIISVFYSSGINITNLEARFLIDPASPVYNTSEAITYRENVLPLVSQDESDAIMEIYLDSDPFGKEAMFIVDQIRDVLKGYQNKIDGMKIYVGGVPAEMKDMINRSYEIFPWMIALVILVVYILVGVMFKSFFLPLRLIITVGLTISFIYGATHIVFELDYFDPYFVALQKTSTVYWMLPIMSFSVLLGLGMDYDIFAIERIKDYVWQGYSNKEAITLALNKTGRVITGAGTVMATAFAGLMFSSSIILVQFSFILTFAVLIDTFIVRTVLVPAILSISKDWNWWPSHPPHEKIPKEPKE